MNKTPCCRTSTGKLMSTDDLHNALERHRAEYEAGQKSRQREGIKMGDGMKRARAAAKATRSTYTKQDGIEAIAKSLREFGYPDATAQMVADTYAAIKEGKSGSNLPHGIIGMFAERQIEEVREAFDALPEAQP